VPNKEQYCYTKSGKFNHLCAALLILRTTANIARAELPTFDIPNAKGPKKLSFWIPLATFRPSRHVKMVLRIAIFLVTSR